MNTFNARSAAVAAIWMVGLVTLALPGVQFCGPAGVGGLALLMLPLITMHAVLRGLSPSPGHTGEMTRVGPSTVGAI